MCANYRECEQRVVTRDRSDKPRAAKHERKAERSFCSPLSRRRVYPCVGRDKLALAEAGGYLRSARGGLFCDPAQIELRLTPGLPSPPLVKAELAVAWSQGQLYTCEGPRLAGTQSRGDLLQNGAP